MEKSLSCCLNITVLIICLMAQACKHKSTYFQQSFTEEERAYITEGLINGCGTDLYYQGTTSEHNLAEEALKFAPQNAHAWRELGVPYLKRGFAHQAYKYYTIASNNDPLTWAGYMGYCWLYFYRDYDVALQQINILDTLTPNFIDYPQATSVDYMRGIIYAEKGDYKKATQFALKHLEKEKNDIGPDYVPPVDYVTTGVILAMAGKFQEAMEILEEGVYHNPKTPELWFYLAQLHLLNNDESTALNDFNNAHKEFNQGNGNKRNYVAEFYQIYQSDLYKMSNFFSRMTAEEKVDYISSFFKSQYL